MAIAWTETAVTYPDLALPGKMLFLSIVLYNIVAECSQHLKQSVNTCTESAQIGLHAAY